MVVYLFNKQNCTKTEKNSEFGDTPNSFQLILKHYR